MNPRHLRLTLLVVLLTLLGGLALAGSASGGGDDSDPSSRSSGAAGTLALYGYVQALGLDTHRVSGDFDLAGTDVLFMVEPVEAVTDDEVAMVDAYLRGGGELVLAVDARSLAAAAGLLSRLGVEPTRAVADGDAVPRQPLDVGGDVHRVSIAGTALGLGGEGVAPLLELSGADVVVGEAVGSGRVYVLGSAYPLSNEGLRVTRPDAGGTLGPTGSDAYALVTAMLERGHPTAGHGLQVGFDEVHHGEGGTAGARTVIFSPVGLAGLLALLVVLVLLASGGRRLGRPVPAGDPGRVPTAGDFVGAMAQLFERSANRASVAARYADELKDAAAQATGVDPHLDDAAFLAALEPWGADRHDAIAAALGNARALAASSPGDAQLLELSRQVDAVETLWSAGAPA